MAAAGALVLIGVVSSSILGLVLTTFVGIRGLVAYLRERRIKKTYQEARTTYQAVNGPAPAATA